MIARRVNFDFAMAKKALELQDALVAQGYEPLNDISFDAEQYTVHFRPADAPEVGMTLTLTGYHDLLLTFIACLPAFDGGKMVPIAPDRSGAKPGAKYPVVVPR